MTCKRKSASGSPNGRTTRAAYVTCGAAAGIVLSTGGVHGGS